MLHVNGNDGGVRITTVFAKPCDVTLNHCINTETGESSHAVGGVELNGGHSHEVYGLGLVGFDIFSNVFGDELTLLDGRVGAHIVAIIGETRHTAFRVLT